MADNKIPSGVPVATSPSPAIDSVAKNSWKHGIESGTPDPKAALAQSYNKNPIEPSSLKK